MTRRENLNVLLSLAGAPAPARKTRNVIIFMADGLRWQEVFGGVDAALMSKESGVEDLPALKKRFQRETGAASREALLPFLWTVVAKQGQIYGNRHLGSEAQVTNGFNFSYPGYNETLCGFGDPRIDSNGKNPNPNVNVLEFLNSRAAYQGQAAAFGAWGLFPYILNASRSGLMVNAGFEPLLRPPVTERIQLLNRLKGETAIWEEEALDAPVFRTALEYFVLHRPRVFFVSLGETDEWAHAGRYDLYLKTAHLFDKFAREMWEAAQSLPTHQGTTAMILATDHGRGADAAGWRSHGQKLPDSKDVWMAFLGPDTRALGERANTRPVTQAQIAATVAALLGEDFTVAQPKAAGPIADVLG